MECFLLLVLVIETSLLCAARVDIPGYDQTEEGNEFYVGFYQNRFGKTNEIEIIPPILWITTKEKRKVHFTVSTIAETLFSGFAKPKKITYVPTNIELIVSESTPNDPAKRFKGIRIKAQDKKKIVVYGQHEELASNDAYLALPLFVLPPGRLYEYIAVSVHGSRSSSDIATDSVALIIGTENNTNVTVIPTESIGFIPHNLAPLKQFIIGLNHSYNTITIGQYETLYLQVRQSPGDISGTRIIADKPISMFSGHECANIPVNAKPCDILIEQIPPVITWGNEVVTIPLQTRPAGDLVKIIAAWDSTTVSITRTDFDSGVVTTDSSFVLNSGDFKEIVTSDYNLIQSNRPIGVFQFSRSFESDNVRFADPFMLYVPPSEQYRDSYAVSTAPFDPSLEGTAPPSRGPYVNYTNIVVPAKYFDANLMKFNKAVSSASNFKPIRKGDNTIWGYGAQLLLDEGAQVVSHKDRSAGMGVTLYGFSNQMSWGYAGGMGLAPIQIPRIQVSDIAIFENAGNGVLQFVRSGPLVESVSLDVATIDGTAKAWTDYRAVSQTVTFAAGQARTSINIPIVDDKILLESDISFTVSLTPNPNVIITSDNPVVTIKDDDGPVVEFSQFHYSTMESNGTLEFILISSAAINYTDYQVRVWYSSGTATGGIDYDDSMSVVNFSAGVTSVTHYIPIIADNVFEGTEEFSLILDIPRAAKRLRVETGDINRAVGEIIDKLTVSFKQSTYTVYEDNELAQPTLILSNPSLSNITVQLLSIDGSATGGNFDYNFVPYTITFPAGVTLVVFDVAINNDNILEDNEDFRIIIDKSSLYDYVTVGSPTTVRLVILDDDTATVHFNQSSYSVNENNSPAQSVLVLSNPSSADITVTVFSTDESATGGIGYYSGPYNVIFSAGETSALLDISVYNNNVFEDTTNFMLTISKFSLPDRINRGKPGNARINIVDDDAVTVSFSDPVYSINEYSRSVQPTLVLSKPSSIDITLQVTDISDCATGGIDYDSGPYDVKFPAGETRSSFNIPIKFDTLVEGDEEFHLTVATTSLVYGFNLGHPSTVKVDIMDIVPLCNSFLRLFRPELFLHCDCSFTQWSSWTSVSNPIPTKDCASGRSIKEIQSRQVKIGECLEQTGCRRICTPSTVEQAEILIEFLGIGRTVEPLPSSNSSSISRRDISRICSAPSGKICTSKKRSIPSENEMYFSDHSNQLLDTNIASKPFNFEERLPVSNAHHLNKRQSTSQTRYLLLMLDTSGSITETLFTEVTTNLSRMIGSLCGNTKIAVMTFSHELHREICFDCNKNSHLLEFRKNISDAIKSIQYRGGGTNTGEAIECACEYMLSPECGFPSNSANETVDVLFITDGRSNGDVDVCKATKCLDNYKGDVLSIGIGNSVNYAELQCIIGKNNNTKHPLYYANSDSPLFNVEYLIAKAHIHNKTLHHCAIIDT